MRLEEREGREWNSVRRTTHCPRVCICVYVVRKTVNDNDDDGRFRKTPTTIGDAKNASAATKTPQSSIRVTETCTVRFDRFHGGPPSRQRNNATPS